MATSKGVIDPAARDGGEMFIGWAGAPAVDRRFLLAALPFGLAAGGAASWAIADNLNDPGAGAWLTNATHRVTGVLGAAPYPVLRVADPNTPFGMRTVLIMAEGKCTSALDLADQIGRTVDVAGVLIQRKDRQAVEVPLFLEDWLSPASAPAENAAALAAPPTRSYGRATLAGTIMDSKCFFGVMRPGRGKTHKACASLCIRGGIPPSFWVRDRNGAETVLLLTNADGGRASEAILPLVADPVEATGDLVRVGDLLQFRVSADAFARL
ncbi:MAG: hypothetical protein AAGC56_09005 [Pseudomonadota bacterium]